MEQIEINGQTLKSLIEYSYNSLLINKKIINDLNVFPIPDGDTGDNMCMTLEGGLLAIKDKSINSISEMAKTCSEGMVNAARGNSGVILSQLFYGFADGLQDLSIATLNNLLSAAKNGVKYGYLAVDKPAEGTMLTVARETTKELEKLDLQNISIDDFMKKLLDIVQTSVEATPEKLAKLKENGVVDSGGAGLYYIVEGCNKYLHGEELESHNVNSSQDDIDYSKFNENSILEFGYCSEVMLQLTKQKTDIDKFDIEALKDYLNSIGDSLVVFQTGYVIKVHVHTFEPYKLLEYCGRFGEFLKVKIENMTLQHSEVHIQNNFAPKIAKRTERKKYGVVAVASGEGIKQTFKDFGADVIIDGGQTNNPPSSDFIKAFDEANCDIIFVLPNNNNVILSAKQAAKNYKASKIYVIETKNIGEGYAVLSMLDFTSNNVEEIIKNMYEEIKNTTTGSITIATRTTKCNNIAITKDDFIGLINKNIITSNGIRIRATCDLIDKMSLNTKDYVVLIYGKNFMQKEKTFVSEYIQSKYNNLEIYEIDGNQDIYDLYIISN